MIIGSRGSALALVQSRQIAEAYGPSAEVRVIRTAGDQTDRLMKDLAQDAFVGTIEQSLRGGTIDAAVHSLKDLPTTGPNDLMLAAIPLREDPRDALITRGRGGVRDLPAGATVGTSSPRRAAFLKALRPDAEVRDIRGNVDTRLRKVQEGECDAVILAVAGLRRLGIALSDEEMLDLTAWPPAPGQGAIAVQVRTSDWLIREQLRALDHVPTRLAVTAERDLLHRLGASCALALGALARVEGEEIVLDAALGTRDGVVRTSVRARDPQGAAAEAATAFSGAVV